MMCCRNAIEYCDSTNYNELPINIRKIDNQQNFKRKLKLHIADFRVNYFNIFFQELFSFF